MPKSSQQLPITKVIQYLRVYHPSVFRGILNERCDKKQITDLLEAVLSVGRTDFINGRWQWMGYWWEEMDEEPWYLMDAKRLLIPPTVDILMEMRN